jgi:general secretion pathway protein J
MRASPQHSAGFTLLELLIAMALIGIMVLLLFSGLRLGTRAWEGVESTADRHAELRIARDFLERELVQARQVEITIDAQRRFIFAGDSQAIEFAAPLSEHVGIAGLYVLRLGLAEGDKHKELILTRWLLHPKILAGNDQVPAWQPLQKKERSFAPAEPSDDDIAAGVYGTTRLLDDVGELEFSYLGAQEGELAPTWHLDWIDQPQPPLAVRVHLTTTQQTWPDTVVRLADPDRQ